MPVLTDTSPASEWVEPDEVARPVVTCRGGRARHETINTSRTKSSQGRVRSEAFEIRFPRGPVISIC